MYSLNVTITGRWILTHLLIINMNFNEFQHLLIINSDIPGSLTFYFLMASRFKNVFSKFLLDESSLVVSHTVDLLGKLVVAGWFSSLLAVVLKNLSSVLCFFIFYSTLLKVS